MMFDGFLGIFVFFLQIKYRKKLDSIKFITVVDFLDLVYVKNSYMYCNEVGVFLLVILGVQQWVVLFSGQCLRYQFWIDVSVNFLLFG